MRAEKDQATLHAANDNPGGATSASIALRGLVHLLARAEARRASGNADNTNIKKNK